MNIERAIASGQRAHERELEKKAAVARREAAKKRRLDVERLAHAKQWVRRHLAAKIKYQASLGSNRLDLDNEGIKGTKIDYIPAESKYRAIRDNEQLSKTVKARTQTVYDVRDYDEGPLYNREDYWVEWGNRW